jgi:hypothetical protein
LVHDRKKPLNEYIGAYTFVCDEISTDLNDLYSHGNLRDCGNVQSIF